ncbi:nucleotidyltransferase [Clostridium botulinum]|uniref:glycosyltransferase family 2 protein n=1 Tax=Clostridium botulinum TaxID=1491 RepID=UPI000772E97F|nr:glycosyltransferase family 2 protein [Clostridium botulinum]MBN1049911.1 nucleotidyltransferase [Clostridium botulinum]MBN1059840.1 nucleotidyltransferase [Clostridium botulinum]MBN1062986.1 nucleotidyltransferase [Clostridium botulinum]MCS6111255.1 nucleotidyltransferase [Clostridium botulinum]NFE10844.1 nucleotidyltransferase [Clostridium botulinum]
MNILIPIAGSNTAINGNEYIKGLYEIEKKIVIQHIYESLSKVPKSKFIFVLRKEDIKSFHLDDTLKLLDPNIKLIVSEGNTQGSACSCLLAIEHIDSDEPLLISGVDQLITRDWNEIIEEFEKRNLDGGVICFDSVHPKWSYVKINDKGYVVEAAEKRPISRNATTGQYYFKKGSDFVSAAENMILKGASVEEQYYVCPSFNELVLKQKTVGCINIDNSEYFSLKDQRGMDAYEEYLKGEKR